MSEHALGELALAAAHWLLAAIMACVAATWAWLIACMRRTFARTPVLGECGPPREAPLVSVILPARNEEGYVGACLDSLRGQDYANYEIVAIDDSSEDSTGAIIARHAAGDSRVVHVSARAKPAGWAGKSWACLEGYRAARGELLLFTDADTVHSPRAVSSAVGDLLGLGLDALTVMPRMRCVDAWARVSLPVISVFLHTRFSATKVNSKSSAMGYFFGSFFLMPRASYEALGTHGAVRGEIVEDGALGRLAKAAGMRIRMARGEGAVSAVWSRDWPTLWNALKRLMAPLYLQVGRLAVGMLVGVAFVVLAPFAAAAYAAPAAAAGLPGAGALLGASLAASAMAGAGALLETRFLGTRAADALGAPLGGLAITLGLLAGILGARSRESVSWRGRSYELARMAGASGPPA